MRFSQRKHRERLIGREGPPELFLTVEIRYVLSSIFSNRSSDHRCAWKPARCRFGLKQGHPCLRCSLLPPPAARRGGAATETVASPSLRLPERVAEDGLPGRMRGRRSEKSSGPLFLIVGKRRRNLFSLL